MSGAFTLAMLANATSYLEAFLTIAIILAVFVMLVSIWLFRKTAKKRCPYCRAAVAAEDQICSNCSHELPPLITSRPLGI